MNSIAHVLYLNEEGKSQFNHPIRRILDVALTMRDNYLAVSLAIVPAILLLTFSMSAQAIPKDETFEKFDDQAADMLELGYRPMNDVSPPVNYTLHPNLTPNINEAHPFPDYIKKFARKGQFPKYYLELIRTLPVNEVQSKIFNFKEFQKVRRIGVADFENKTARPFRDENAGHIVANQIYQELQADKRYQIIPPRISEDARIRITKTPVLPGDQGKSISEGTIDRSVASLPHSKNKVDAVLIGAVTKYMDTFINRRGEIKKSISSGVEFGAFLVNAKTGDVIWGARFVGTQTPSITEFLPTIAGLLHGKSHWLSKEEFSRSAIKRVLKTFRDTQNKNR